MIITVTLNPALDKTIEIDNFAVDAVNKSSKTRVDAGGKGINVSKVIKSLGGTSKAVGILSGNSGRFIKKYLDEENIENDFTFTQGETRTNVKIVDKQNHTNTDVNELGPEVSENDLNEVQSKFLKELDEKSVIVFSGSIPRNANKNIYKLWIEKAKAKGAKTLLDAEGELLRQGIEAGPYLIKPNIHELEGFFGKKIEDKKEAVVLSRKLLEYGIKVIVISLGGDGALFINEKDVILGHGIKVNVSSTVGAGDSMVAALAVALHDSYDFESAIRLAVACGTASVTTAGTQAADMDTVMKFEKMVQLEHLNY